MKNNGAGMNLSVRQRFELRNLCKAGAFILEIFNADPDNEDTNNDSVSIRSEIDEGEVHAMYFRTLDAFIEKGLIQKVNNVPIPIGGHFYSNKYKLTQLGLSKASAIKQRSLNQSLTRKAAQKEQ
jgi:hypothetical protein